MREDDGKADVFFDTKYDVTRYDIDEEFNEQKMAMSAKEYREFLIQHLIRNVGLNERQANIESEALINKKRRVSEGDYAFIQDESNYIYFKRNAENMWVKDESMETSLPLSAKMFCNISNNCIQIKNNCETLDINKSKLGQPIHILKL